MNFIVRKGLVRNMRKIKIAILGFGTVGCQIYQYLKSESEHIRELFQVEIEVVKIYVRDINKERSIKGIEFLLTDQGYDAIDAADLIMECIGGNGSELSRELVQYAIRKEKPVILSSKKCLAFYGRELFGEAVGNHVPIYYDACVGGGIPISRNLKDMGRCEQIKKIYGIVNATSNVILEDMSSRNMTFQEALLQAQKQGIAENDPSEDVDGYDALYKAIILAGITFGTWISVPSVQPESLRDLTEGDFAQEKTSGYVIKQVFEINCEKETIVCSVQNRLVDKDSLIACVKGRNNIIIIDSTEAGERAFYGQGAGAKPTASAMFDDMILCLSHIIKP